MKKIVVIGAGFAGLSTAALLAKHGYQVTVLEKNPAIGGRARTYEEKGFTFDMGPSWYMMPDAFDTYFSHFNTEPTDFFKLEQLKTHYKVFFSAERTYEIKKNLADNVALFERVEKGAGKKLEEFLQKSKFLYETSMKRLVYLDYQSPLALFSPEVLTNLPKLMLHRSFHSFVAEHFTNPDLQKILEFTTVFLGVSAYDTPAFYTLISHADFGLGIWYPKGGIISIIKALEKLCLKHNATILTNENVKSITVEKGKATSVVTNSQTYTCDLVVNSADYPFCETQLLEKQWQTHPSTYWQKKTLSPSALLIYLGIRGTVKNLSHHNLYFDPTWLEHYQAVYQRPGWPEHPSYYVHCPSKTDSSIVPKDSEAVIMLVPLAPGLQDDDNKREAFANKCIQHLEILLNDTFSSRIVVKKLFSQSDFISSYNAYKGTAFGLAHTLFQSSLFRPKNKSNKVNNLYYVGQFTNPGIGMPICLISSQIVYNMIRNDN